MACAGTSFAVAFSRPSRVQLYSSFGMSLYTVIRLSIWSLVYVKLPQNCPSQVRLLLMVTLSSLLLSNSCEGSSTSDIFPSMPTYCILGISA